MLLRFDESGWDMTTFPSPLGAYIFSIASDGKEGAWVSHAEAGIAHYDGASWSFHDVVEARHIANIARVIRMGRDGRVWVGTVGGGLLVFDPSVTSDVPMPGSEAGARVLSVSPNPTTGSFALHLTLNTTDHVRATLVNMMGEVVAVLHDGDVEQGSHIVQVDAGEVGAGVYYVRLNHTGGVESVPVVVVR
jgi:hypothetical protein